MPAAPGRSCALPPSQRYLTDLAWLARPIPMASVQRTFFLEPLVTARAAAGPRPSWSALFTKALAFVAAANPELRQLYQGFPVPCLYEHPEPVAAVGLARPLDEGVPWLWARLRGPQRLGLLEIDNLLGRFREGPLEKVSQVRRVRARARWPEWARRLAWWRDMASSGARRARRLGTMAVASVGQHGADLVDPLYPATAVLTYGALTSGSVMDVRLKFDARLLAVNRAAAILQDLERALLCEIVMELRYYQQPDAA
jgi:hypothetical protein